MKVVHLVASGGLYGKEQVILELMRAHSREGIDCVLGSIRVEGDEPKEVVKIAEEEGLNTHTFFLRRGLDLRGGRGMARWLCHNNADIAHIHDYKASVLLGMQRWRCKTPPLVRTLHGFTTTRTFSAIALYEWMDRQSLRFHDRIVGVSEEMKGVTRYPMTIIRNGIQSVDLDHDYSLNDVSDETKEFASDGITLGTIARLSGEKNQKAMIQAVGLLASRGLNVKLLIVGEGPERESLESCIKENELENRVRLHGFANQARRFLSLMDVYLQPSTTEGTPISILEAMDAGVPIGMSRVGAMASLLDQGCGFSVSLDAESMAKDIEGFLSNTKQKASITNKARQIFHEIYSAKIMTDAYLDIYQRITAI